MSGRVARSRDPARGRHFLFLGTLAPARLASDRPMAIACLRLFTLARERPLRSLPRFISCIARLTLRPLDLPYLLAIGVSGSGLSLRTNAPNLARTANNCCRPDSERAVGGDRGRSRRLP